MVDPSFQLRSGPSGPIVRGTPGDVLTFGADGRTVSGRPHGDFYAVQSIAERNSFSAAPLYCRPGMQVWVEDLLCVYELAYDLATWSLFTPSPRLALQRDWYVSLTGNDNADGKTKATAITQQELQRRLFPNCSAMMMRSDVTIHVAAGSYLTQFFAAAKGIDGLDPLTLTIDYEISSSAEMALTAVIATNGQTRTRGRLTVGAGSPGFSYRQRVRLTTGVAAGAVAYCNDAAAASSLAAFVTLWGPTDWPLFHIPLQPQPGDRCVIDNLLTTSSRLEIDVHPRVRILVKNARITRAIVNGVSTETGSADNGGNVFFSGCNAVSVQGMWECNAGGAVAGACLWEPNTKTTLQGVGWLNLVSCVQGWMGIVGACSSYGLSIDAGALFVGAQFTTAYPEHSGTGYFAANRGYIGGGSIEVQNGPGPSSPSGLGAVNVRPGSVLVVGDLVDCEQWGAASAPYTTGYVIWPGAFVYQNQPGTGTIAQNFAITSTNNINAGGEIFAYSDNEVFVPNQNCGLLALGTTVGPRSYTDAQFYLTAQSANLAAATFAAGNFTAGAGLYRVSGYVATTTNDAAANGTPTLNILFTDDSGIARTVPVVVGPSLTTLGGAGSDVTIEVSAATAKTVNSIRWSVSGLVTPAAARYSVRCRVEKLSSGA